MPITKVKKENGQDIGMIEMDCLPAYTCQYQVTLYKVGPNGEKEHFMKIQSCQCNCHTCCSVDSCGSIGTELNFNLVGFREQSPENFVKKVHSSCWKECCSAADCYDVSLPVSEDEAALVMAAVQMIDMLYFENPWGFATILNLLKCQCPACFVGA